MPVPTAESRRHFVPRPAKHFPGAFVTYLRRSLDEGAGRIGRVWIEELYDVDEPAVTDWAIGVELRGDRLSDAAFEDADADIRARLLAAPGIDSETASVFVFETANDSSEANYFRGLEPLFGEAHTRLMRLAEFERLAPAPRTLPEDLTRAVEEEEVDSSPGTTTVVIALAALGIGALIYWLIPGTGGWRFVRWGALLLLVAFAALTIAEAWRGPGGGTRASGGAGGGQPEGSRGTPRETNPLVLAAVVQARHELFDPEHRNPLDIGRYGAVLAYTLDPTWRNDPAYLGWLGRRLGWLRDNEAETADETRIAQRLEAEADDMTRRLPASVTGNDLTFWATPYLTHRDLPGRVIPEDRLLPILLTTDDVARPDEVDLLEVWPEAFWPLRDRPPVGVTPA